MTNHDDIPSGLLSEFCINFIGNRGCYVYFSDEKTYFKLADCFG